MTPSISKFIQTITCIFIVLMLCSCHRTVHQPAALKTTPSQPPAAAELSLPDSVSHLLQSCLTADTFEYTAFYTTPAAYQLLFVKSGRLFRSTSQQAVVLYSVNDTTIACRLYTENEGQWQPSCPDAMLPVTTFSPAYFNTHSDDYNFDDFPDLKVDLYTTMGVCYSTGYLLTYNADTPSLTLHPEALDIGNMTIDKKNQAITSTTYLDRHGMPDRTGHAACELTHIYQWKNGRLKWMRDKKTKLTEGSR